MTSDEDRAKLEKNADAYMTFGNLDKPFHRPECECPSCEQWRRDNNRPTYAELNAKKNAKGKKL